jgi:NAD(P)-dependent dehydrogenase (short-subunit alcohol dehydrogenase family)
MVQTIGPRAGWDASDIPDLSGRRFLITGATSGLGLASARALVGKGAHVTITARNADKGRDVLARGGASEVLEMDLTDLASVRAAASRITQTYDVVILNAGVMWTPYALTTDGFELQVGTNHLGHFAFAGLIKDFITGRIVTVSSLYHRFGTFGNHSIAEIRRRCLGESPYAPRSAYGDSKLANLLFTKEIERRRVDHHWPFIAVAAHPGWSNTHLFDTATESKGLASTVTSLASRYLAQSAQRGALPQLCAATFPGLVGGEYLGPRGPGELRGTPKVTKTSALAGDEALAKNLGSVSEQLTGVTWK